MRFLKLLKSEHPNVVLFIDLILLFKPSINIHFLRLLKLEYPNAVLFIDLILLFKPFIKKKILKWIFV